MYIGSVEEDTYLTWVFDSDTKTFVKKDVKFVPGLYKIFDEILVNSLDHVARMKQNRLHDSTTHLVKNIRINIDKNTGVIEVTNDGEGVDVEIHPEHGVWIPELIFGNLLTSANYDDDEEKLIGGQNGIGAKACNIYSKMFYIETIDSKRKKIYKQTFSDNMSTKTEPIVKSCSKKPYTTIKFLPDYERFKLQGLTDDTYDLFIKRCYDVCALTDTDVHVFLNGVKLEYKSFEKYVDLYIGGKNDQGRVYELVNDRWEIVASYNEHGTFEQVSFVNGIWTIKGGKHVDYIANQITNKLIEVLNKKRKELDIKPVHIKNHLFLFVKCLIPNPRFDSQSKETLTTNVSSFGSKPELSDKFMDRLYKTGLIDNIIKLSQALDNKSIKKTDGKKKSKLRGLVKLDDANFAGTNKSKECTLILTEGDSAKSTAIAGLSVVGRDKFGVFPLRGKVLNVQDVSIKKLTENEEITNIKKILGLESNKTYTNLNELRYGKIMIMTDQDTDGSHIKGLLFNLFLTLWPSLLKTDGFLSSMLTPIVKARYKKQVLSFYNIGDYETWRDQTPNVKQWSIKYYKGLGTSTDEEAKEYFKNLKQVTYVWEGESSANSLDLAFNKKKSNDRKQWLENYNKKDTIDHTNAQVSYGTFVHKELIHFSNYDIERSIPCLCDGLKVSQRKIMYSCFKKSFDKEIKVAQLSGYVSEVSGYHHGEASLNGAIVGLAQDFVGSNNINLLEPIGQFGTRLQGGKDASSPRYIYTQPSKLIPLLFKKDDQHILTYLDDDGFPIEPEFYVPVIPLVLVNGAIGIGTGFSTNVPCFNPRDVINLVIKRLTQPDFNNFREEIKPWYMGFKGTIEKHGDKFVSRGLFTRIAPTKIRVTELPIGTWTEDYKEFLESCLDAKGTVLKNYELAYDHETVDFTLVFASKDVLDTYLTSMDEVTRVTKFESEFKLISPKMLSMSNMYLLNRHGQITKYHSTQDIVDAFVEVRLEYYELRKQYILAKLTKDIDILEAKARFIRQVIASEVIIYNMAKDKITRQLMDFKYPIFEEDDGSKFDYLLKMPLYSLTLEKKQELEDTISRLTKERNMIQQRTVTELWLMELEDLRQGYDAFLKSKQK